MNEVTPTTLIARWRSRSLWRLKMLCLRATTRKRGKGVPEIIERFPEMLQCRHLVARLGKAAVGERANPVLRVLREAGNDLPVSAGILVANDLTAFVASTRLDTEASIQCFIIACERGDRGTVQYLENQLCFSRSVIETGLWATAQQGHVVIVRHLLPKWKATSKNAKDDAKELQSLLLAVMRRSHAEVAEVLIDAVDDVKVRDEIGRTLLQDAVRTNSLELVRKMLRLLPRSGIDTVDLDGVKAIHVAYNNRAIMEALVGWGARADIFTIAAHGTKGEVRSWLREHPEDRNRQLGTGEMPLQFAMYSENVASIEALIESGCDPYHCASYGGTALHWACKMNLPKAVESILNAGTDAEKAEAVSGIGLGHLALREGSIEAVECLMRHGVAIPFRDANGSTLLDFMVRANDRKVFEKLGYLIQEASSRDWRKAFRSCILGGRAEAFMSMCDLVYRE